MTMNFMTQLLIAWMMFKDYMKRVFGGGCEFYTLAPGYQGGYSK